MNRKDFLTWMGLMLLGAGMQAEDTAAKPMPSLFLGHGSPMNIVEQNDFVDMLKELGVAMKRPTAIVVVSAHW